MPRPPRLTLQPLPTAAPQGSVHGRGRPEIDVLLPVRGARRTLPSACADLLAQRDVSVRVIAIVDDARPAAVPDASRAWVEDLATREPRLLVLRGPGRGAGAALDVGLAAVTTGSFAHMEADDRCPPDRLARLHAALHATSVDGTRDTPLAAVVSRAAQCGARTPGMRRYLDWQNALLTHRSLAEARFLEIPALHQTGLYRTAAVRTVGGYKPRGAWPLDLDFWLRWFEHDALRGELPVLKLPRVLYRWRQHDAQSTRAGDIHGGSHALDALRAGKAHYLARLIGRAGATPRPVLLLSTGRTLVAWRDALLANGVDVSAALEWRPGQALPAAVRSATSELLLAAFGMAPARARLASALSAEGIAPDGQRVLWIA